MTNIHIELPTAAMREVADLILTGAFFTASADELAHDHDLPTDLAHAVAAEAAETRIVCRNDPDTGKPKIELRLPRGTQAAGIILDYLTGWTETHSELHGWGGDYEDICLADPAVDPKDAERRAKRRAAAWRLGARRLHEALIDAWLRM